MKIIGKTEDGFILDVSAKEIANLIGYYSEYSDPFKVKVGDEIAISDMYRQLDALAAQDKEIQDCRNTLLQAYRHLELVSPVKIKVGD